MSLLTRLDPGGPGLHFAASTVVIFCAVAVGAELIARTIARRASSWRHDVYLAALALILLSPAIVGLVGRSGLVLLALPGRPVSQSTADREFADVSPDPIEAAPATPPVVKHGRGAEPEPPRSVPTPASRPPGPGRLARPVVAAAGRWSPGLGLLSHRAADNS
jgi:hypothetical protein